MVSISRREFNEIIVEGIRRSGWSEVYMGRMSAHPFRVAAVMGETSHPLSVYMWSVTHGGATRSAAEYRIQVQVRNFEVEDGYQTLVLGWWKEGGLFVGFDVKKHQRVMGDNASIQVAQATLKEAAIQGFAIQTGKGNQELVAAFRPEYFMTYVQNIRQIHDFGVTPTALNVLKDAVNPSKAEDDVHIESLSKERQIVAVTVTKRVRLANFREKVLRAYDHRCALCDLQLELIDAAHIVPVAAQSSTDETDNGLAVCSLHHRAYDAALLTVHEDYTIEVSKRRIDQLRVIKRVGGLDDFVDDLREVINVPPNATDYPNPKNLLRGKALRGWI